MFGPFLFLFFSVCREMNAVGARIPDDNYELNFVICDGGGVTWLVVTK